MVLVERVHQSLDEQVIAERLNAISDWYYLYQHERVGVFRAVVALQERLHRGDFQFGRSPIVLTLRHFDAREVLYYTRHDRRAAYTRLFGYGHTPLSPQPNAAFRDLFYRFNQLVVGYHHTHPISPATIRQAALALRNNLFQASYGQIHVLRLELLQLLEVALRLCDSQAIQQGLNVDTRWDVIALSAGGNLPLNPEARLQMALAGRTILRWFAQQGVLQQTGQAFEADVDRLAPHAQTWLTASETARATRRGSQLPRLQLSAPFSSE